MILELCGQIVDVRETENQIALGDECIGRCLTAQNKILIFKRMPNTMKDATVLHEAMHYMAESHGLDLTESETTSLSTALYQMLRKNPVFITGLVGRNCE